MEGGVLVLPSRIWSSRVDLRVSRDLVDFGHGVKEACMGASYFNVQKLSCE